MIMSVTSESSVCTTPPMVVGGTGGPNGGTSMWNNLLELSSFKSSPDDTHDQDASCNANGRSNGTAGYPGLPFASAASTFIRSSEHYKLPKMLIDSGSGQQQGFLGQPGKGAAPGASDTLGDVARYHELITSSQPASPSCLSDRVASDDQRKMNTFKELNDLRVSCFFSSTLIVCGQRKKPAKTFILLNTFFYSRFNHLPWRVLRPRQFLPP